MRDKQIPKQNLDLNHKTKITAIMQVQEKKKKKGFEILPPGKWWINEMAKLIIPEDQSIAWRKQKRRK